MTELVVSRAALKNNLGIIRERAGGRALIGVLAHNAYGLGLVPTAKFLYEEGVRFFAVGDTAEAEKLRAGEFADIDILMLRPTCDPAEVERIIDLGVIATVGGQDSAMALSGLAERRGTVAEAHVRVDTGFGHYGFSHTEPDKILSVYRYMGSIAFTGLYTQYAPYGARKALLAQSQSFGGVVEGLRAAKIETGLIHAAGVGALLSEPKTEPYDALRVGVALGGAPEWRRAGLVPAAKLRASLTDTGHKPAGAVLGGKAIKKAARAGIVPMGTADGLGRTAQTRPPTFAKALARLIRGESAPVLRLADGKKLKVLGRAGIDAVAVNLGSSDIAVGADVYADIDPLVCVCASVRHI
ncbi:MAG: alanine racemase [Oscillospiraceae bacterium]|jgi:alanine racemase|nr:alanine racemase [Oscillospiraceae bacterium]